MKQSIKVLVLGDDGVGKSSLICTLISNNNIHDAGIPDIYQDVSIPGESCWDINVDVTIMDSSPRISENELRCKVKICIDHASPPKKVNLSLSLSLKVLDADSIVLVYDVERRETLDRLMSYWLPFISDLTTAPIIIAGNKVTLPLSRFLYRRARIISRTKKQISTLYDSD